MNEAGKFEEEKTKLEKLCADNNLVFHFYPNNYPVQMVFQPTSNIDSQMSMLERDEAYISPDAKLTYIMQDGDIEEKTEGRTQWPKSLKDKLLRSFKNMHLLYLEFFHRNLMERNILAAYQLPQISEDDVEETPSHGNDEAEYAASGAETAQISILADKATNLARMENKASAGLLERRMNISEGTALRVLKELTDRGVVSVDESLNFEVLPYDLPDDEG